MFVNPATTLRRGFEEQDEASYSSRLRKRRDMQAILDQAASEGRTLGYDEMMDLMRDQIGAAGVLTGDMPTSATAEAMRANANLKAEQVQRDQQFQRATRENALDAEVRSRAAEAASSGKSETDIYEMIRDTWGDDLAKRYKQRIPAFISSANLEGQKNGAFLAQNIYSEDEVEDEIKRQPHLSEFEKNGMRATARANADKADAIVGQISAWLGSSGGFRDDQATRDAVRSKLPAFMQRSPKVNEYVERAMRGAAGDHAVVRGGVAQGLADTSATTYAQKWPEIQAVVARQRQFDAEDLRQKIATAADNARAALQARAVQQTAGLSQMAKSKGKDEQARAAAALSFLSEYDVQDPSAIVAAAGQGDREFAEARARAMRTAVPLATIQQASVDQARAAAGDGFTGDVGADYAHVARIGSDPTILANIGATVALDRRNGNEALAKQTYEKFLNGIVAGARMTRDTLAGAARAGQFGASAEQLAQMEREMIRQKVSIFANSAGLEPDQLVDAVLQALGPPTAIVRQPGIGERFNSSINEGLGQNGQVAPSGRPGALPPPGAAPAPGAPAGGSLVPTVERLESGGRDFAPDGSVLTSSAGAEGRMQVMPDTARDPGYGVTPARDNSLAERARVGRDYISRLQQIYRDDGKALAAYNAGPGRLDRVIAEWGNDWLAHMPLETRLYVARGLGMPPENALRPPKLPWSAVLPPQSAPARPAAVATDRMTDPMYDPANYGG